LTEPERNNGTSCDIIAGAASGSSLFWTLGLRGGSAVIGGHYFKRLRPRRSSLTPGAQLPRGDLYALLFHDVIERFASLGDAGLSAIPLDVSEVEDAEDPPANPGHPACTQYAGSDYCRESWQLHLAELKRQPETHWHKCDHGLLCAIVPIVYRDRCLAAVKIACPDSMSEEDFARQVELLDILAKEFVIANTEYLERLSRAQEVGVKRGKHAPEITVECVERRRSHPRILKAIRKIEEQIADPKLTVGRVARELKMDPSYLAHLFVEQVGQRMSRFIAARRIELAKDLLATTDWQIKRIAQETGHANANWFCCVFRSLSGLTPGAYRRQSRDRSHAAPAR
jgi:AraC-like DNA-binding protein